jgi:predicted enzyme related to lactoylglutathione lyase
MTTEWDGIAPHWAIYVHVPDVDAAVSKARELGGSVPVAPFDAKGVGRIALLGDPTGAMCYVITLTPPA